MAGDVGDSEVARLAAAAALDLRAVAVDGVTVQVERDGIGVDGPVARIELDPDGLQPDDPALASRSPVPLWREQALDATCARLLTLRKAPPPLAWRTVPEVADRPSSPDGREWTFRIRPGFRFSPPSNAQVTATSMHHTIERALSPRMGSAAPARAVLGDVVGLAAFRSGRARHISGLSARGDRLVIRLRAPARHLPLRMSSRAFCAVPDDTPAGAIRFASTPIPSAARTTSRRTTAASPGS